MNIRSIAVFAALAFPMASCSFDKASPYTLYRTSSMAPGARIHWATFNADESSPIYNRQNCGMAARLLTANMKALNGEDYNPALGFWCEEGEYNPEGAVPQSFVAEYPTDTM
jgi:hypothetical protein